MVRELLDSKFIGFILGERHKSLTVRFVGDVLSVKLDLITVCAVINVIR